MPDRTVSAVSTDERLRSFEFLTEAGLPYLAVEELLAALLDKTREVLRADTAATLLVSPAGDELIATAAKGVEEEVRQGIRIPIGKGFAGRIAADRQARIIDDVGEGDVINPILREKGIRSLLGVPLLVDNTVLGVLHVGTLQPRVFTTADARLLQLVGDCIALAVQARLSDAERVAASELRRSLLPAHPPTVPGLELAARYVSGEAGQIGGDWYDAFVLPSGHLGIVIGDVTGHGLKAAVIMGRLRSALRAYALETIDPSAVLDKLDGKVRHFEPNAMATVLYGVFDPSLALLRLSSAGHLGPLLAVPDRPATPVVVPADLPIGVHAPQGRHTTTVTIEPGATLYFFTDGLVERRDSSLDAGLHRLREVALAGEASKACAAVMSALVGSDPISDDIALLVARRTPPAP